MNVRHKSKGREGCGLNTGFAVKKYGGTSGSAN